MTIDDEAMAEQRLLAAVAAVRVAVDSSAPSRPSEHGSPASDEWMIVLEQPAVEQETRNHSAHWALSGIAALLVAGLAGILLVIGRPTPTVVPSQRVIDTDE